MGGRKRYIDRDLPLTALRLAEAIIRDYPRRYHVVKYSATDDLEVLEKFKNMNNIIDEIVAGFDPRFSKIILNDIIDHKGYDISFASSFSSRNTYYLHRKKLLQDVCKAMHII
jgi:hypothetical protein